MSRERPIIFGADSVRSILADVKTQTRRVVTPHTSDVDRRTWQRLDLARAWADPGLGGGGYLKAPLVDVPGDPADHRVERVRCRNQIGDRLWVREAWTRVEPHPCIGDDFEPFPEITYAEMSETQRAFWRRRVAYGATVDEDMAQEEWHAGPIHWRSPIHMPRWACRLVLEITDVRVERLLAITEEDARAEGVDRDTEPCDHRRLSCDDVGCLGPTYRASFCEGWDALNARRGFPWKSNPWVWAITFRRVDAEEARRVA